MRNPYTPGPGAAPAVLVDREALLRRAEAGLTVTAANGEPTPSVTTFTGQRGVGKTVLLRRIGALATNMGFASAYIGLDRTDAGIAQLARVVAESVAPLRTSTTKPWQRLVERLDQFSLEISAAGLVKASARWDATATDAQQSGRPLLRDLLIEASSFARSAGGQGLALCIDEIQDCPGEQLGQIAHALQDTISEGAPLALYAAGLAHAPETIMQAASFTERFDFRPVSRLDHDAATVALLRPAREKGVEWDPRAAQVVLQRAAGSPFLIQRYGYECWMVADPTPAGPYIDLAAAAAAITVVDDSLASGMFRGRWNNSTPREQEFLAAMAGATRPDTGHAAMRDIAQTLGKTHQQLGMTRQRLIDKGLIAAPRYGQVEFTMPGFERFVLEISDDQVSDRAALTAQPTEPELPRPALPRSPQNDPVPHPHPPPRAQ